MNSEKKLELGQKSAYESQYDATKLFPISRTAKRIEIGIDPTNPPFFGYDLWNHYEVSWLNTKGKPLVATAEILYDCNSPNIIESKSLKLYFNTLNNTQFNSIEELESVVTQDLTQSIEAAVLVRINQLGTTKPVPLHDSFIGYCIDDLDVACSVYTVEPSFLTATEEWVDETLYSDLLKSNCLVTYQPDWGSVRIEYKGPKINREGLLKYIVSFRNHNEFHEQCIERIFIDILTHCEPEELTVYGRYTRRGGVDINPYRSTNKLFTKEENSRLPRQ